MTEQLEKLTQEDGRSLDLEAQNIEQLKQLFPDVFREGKVDFEALKAVLGEHVEDNEERYNFTWHGKNKARQIAQTPSTGTLRPCKEESVNWDTTQNLFIEGDNLEVLKLLQKSYHQKVKMIYIDPPYNTGKDFVYKDNFHDNINNYLELTGQVDEEGKKLSGNSESSGRYHTDWLNMMYPRLKLARNLLKSNGAIFISIDDNEVVNLRKLCDEIFGEDNFIANLVWQKKYAPQNDASYFSDMHDHILVYAKNKKSNKNDKSGWNLDLLPRTASQNAAYKNPDNDPRGVWRSDNLSVKRVTEKDCYEITSPSGKVNLPPKGRSWVVSKEKYKQLLAEDRIWFGLDGNNVPSYKRFLTEVQDGTVPVTWWTYQDCGHNQDSKKELISLMKDSELVFDTPKPVKLIKRMIHLASKSDPEAIILDFFAGSGTTAHAVMEFNAENGGDRKFIGVQLPELIDSKEYDNLAKFTKHRISNACEMVKESFPETEQKIGFKSFKLAETNINQWNSSFDNLSDILDNSVDSIKSERSSEDVLYEVLLKYGLDLTYPITEHKLAGKTVYDVAFGSLIVCLDDGITREVVEGIGKLKQELDSETTRVVFKDSGFADDSVKVNAIQMLKQYGVDDVKSI